ncbi:hypothetical protein MT1_1846 [Pseudomonas sp. MT-1]|nr:hypothetical protein MT1_1846 [Pseudomonas sp. MT-1]
MTHLDTFMPLLIGGGAAARTKPSEGIEIIDPQPHALAVLCHQLPRKPPGHADVTVIVDDDAKDVPACFN